MQGKGVDEAELRSELSKRGTVKARRIFCQIAAKKMGYLVWMMRAYLL